MKGKLYKLTTPKTVRCRTELLLLTAGLGIPHRREPTTSWGIALVRAWRKSLCCNTC